MFSIIVVLSLLLDQEITCSNIDEHLLPKGHLQPLGSHSDPQTNLIDDLQQVPSAEEFWEKYVKPSKAVVFRGAAKHSPAFTQWTDEYLRQNFPDLEVRVERKTEKSGEIPVGSKGVGRDTVANFIGHYHQSNSYIVSELPTPMWKDIHIQPCIACGTMSKRLVEVDLWMSGGGSSSILHKDAFNAINCLYNGTKEWKMIEYKYEDKIYKAYEPGREIGGFSRINPLKVDLLKYPKIAEVPWSFVTINAGDCLFLPKSYYHQVTSHGTMNVAVAILFSRFDNVTEINLSNCYDNVTYTPLNEVDMDWKYSGYGNLSMGNPDLEDVRAMLKNAFRENNSTDALINMFKEVFPEKSEEWILQKAQNILKSVGINEKKSITLIDIEELSRDDLRKISLAFEPTDLSNTEFHEYTYVDSGHIREIVQSLQDSEGKMDKQKFIEMYKKETLGTEKFANEILMQLSKDQSDRSWVSQDEIQSNLERALQPFVNNQREVFIPPGQNNPEPNDAYEEENQTDNESDSDNQHIEL